MDVMADGAPRGPAAWLRDVAPGSLGRVGVHLSPEVMVGHTTDPDRERQLTQDFGEVGADFRPDILGGVVGIHDDETFTQAFYFTSEQEARQGEKLEPPAELRAAFEE